MIKRIVPICAAAVGLLVLVGCSGGGRYELEQQVSMTMLVTMGVVDENGFLDVSHTCEGADTSPTVTWSGAPAGTKSFALVFEDIDISEDPGFEGEEGAKFAHWIVYALPPDTVGLGGPMPSGTLMGINDFDKGSSNRSSRTSIQYSGPCPSSGDPAHTIVFTVYALDSENKLSAGESRDKLLQFIDGKILAAGQATVEFQATGQ